MNIITVEVHILYTKEDFFMFFQIIKLIIALIGIIIAILGVCYPNKKKINIKYKKAIQKIIKTLSFKINRDINANNTISIINSIMRKHNIKKCLFDNIIDDLIVDIIQKRFLESYKKEILLKLLNEVKYEFDKHNNYNL